MKFFLLAFLLFFQSPNLLSQRRLQFEDEFKSQDIQELRGKWDFYWDVLLTPAEIRTGAHPPRPISVPSSWEKESNMHSLLGCGTFSASVLLPETAQNLSLYFPFISTASKVWINDALIDSTGTLSTDRGKFKGQLAGIIVPIPAGLNRFQLTIQVCNYTYFSSGIVIAPQIGTTAEVIETVSRSKGINNALIGCLLAMFIYHLILFFLYRRGLSYLFLAGICLIVCLRAMVINGGTYLLPEMFPEVEMEFWKKIEFFCVYSAVILFPLYIWSLFRAETSMKIVWVFISVAIPLLLTVIFFPQYIYGSLLNVCHVALLLEFVFAGYVIFRAWKNKREEAPIILLGVACAFPPIFFEIINNSGIFTSFVHLDFLVETGILTFLLFQSYLLAKINANAHNRLEILYVDLERIVNDRTRELTDANQLKDRLLSIVMHDIKSPLNSLKGLLSIFNLQPHADPQEFKHFTHKVEVELQRVIGVTNDILGWTSTQIKGTVVVREKFNIKRFLLEHVGYFTTAAEKKNIALAVDVCPDLHIETDKNIMSLVLRNLITNAIKFSAENSRIRLSAEKQSSLVVLAVQDAGVGISHETVKVLFNKKDIISTRGTHNEKGTGLGLILCKQYLELIGGKISVSSVPGSGSTFFVKIPESYVA